MRVHRYGDRFDNGSRALHLSTVPVRAVHPRQERSRSQRQEDHAGGGRFACPVRPLYCADSPGISPVSPTVNWEF